MLNERERVSSKLFQRTCRHLSYFEFLQINSRLVSIKWPYILVITCKHQRTLTLQKMLNTKPEALSPNQKSLLGWMFWTVRTGLLFVWNTNSPWEMFVFAFSVKAHVCLLIALDLSSSPTGVEKKCLLWKWDFLQLCLVFVYCRVSRPCSVCAGWLLVRCPTRASIRLLAHCCLFANMLSIFFLPNKNVQKLDIGNFLKSD